MSDIRDYIESVYAETRGVDARMPASWGQVVVDNTIYDQLLKAGLIKFSPLRMFVTSDGQNRIMGRKDDINKIKKFMSCAVA